jgi:hypothetical protein
MESQDVEQAIRRSCVSVRSGWSPDEGQADGSFLFRPRPSTRATLRTPEGPGELTPDQGPPDVAFTVT